ncbi:hypothetical protein [Streptomyces sp. CA-132043]|uniref:hypothetical protein n=1 Tax=Streptomyces sp. CA-132043 TaxID=3240048 RepID=UPI003D8F223A
MNPDTSVCRRCGMPLAYDAYLLAAEGRPSSPDSELCRHCATGTEIVDRTGQSTDNKWILDLVLRTYQAKSSRGARALASALGKVPGALPSGIRSLTDLVNSVPEKRPGSVDAMVLYSGGKDSSWMLIELAQRQGLNVVAWMLDQGYQSPAAIKNARELCDKLGVELVIAKPERDPMDTLFRLGFGVNETGDPELIRAAMTYGSACWPCFATIAAQATLFCRDNDVAFCFIGTQKGQNRMDLAGSPALSGGALPPVTSLLDKFVAPMREHARATAPASAELLTTADCRSVLIPFYEFVEKPPFAEQIADLENAGWHMPRNTGACSTNCMMNELGRKVMRNQYGFDLYQIIDANERRLSDDPEPAPAAALDEDAVRRGAKLMELTPVERLKFGVDE